MEIYKKQVIEAGLRAGIFSIDPADFNYASAWDFTEYNDAEQLCFTHENGRFHLSIDVASHEGADIIPFPTKEKKDE